MIYQEKIEQTKNNYPFERWQKSFENETDNFYKEVYTEKNCNRIKKIFDK